MRMSSDCQTPHRMKPARRVFVLVAAAAFVFLYLRTFLLPATPFFATGDQVLFFARAERILGGQVPFRDFFELVPPGTDLLYAAGFRLWGVHAALLQAWSIAVGVLMTWLVTRIASRMFRGLLVFLPALLFLVLDFNSALDMTHHWYSTAAVLAMVDTLARGQGKSRIAAASLFCGVATLFTQTTGALGFAAMLVYLGWLRWQPDSLKLTPGRVAAALLPYCTLVSGLFGYYALKAGWRVLFFDLIIFPTRYLSSGEVNSPRTYLHQLPGVHGVSDLIRIVPFLFVYALVPFAYFGGLVVLWSRWKRLPSSTRAQLVLLHLTGISLFLSVASGPRFFRLCTVAPPAILVFLWILDSQKQAARRTRTLLLAVGTVYLVFLPLRRQRQPHITLPLPIGRTTFEKAGSAEQFSWLAARTHPGDLFFNDAALGLYLSLRNPTALDFVADGPWTRPAEMDALVRALQRDPPRWVAVLPLDARASVDPVPDTPFLQLVESHYHLAQVFYPAGQSGYREQMWELSETRKAKP